MTDWDTLIGSLVPIARIEPATPAPPPEPFLPSVALDASERYFAWVDPGGVLRVYELAAPRLVLEHLAFESRTLFSLDGGFACWAEGDRRVTVVRGVEARDAVLPESLGEVVAVAPDGARLATDSVIAGFPSMNVISELPDDESEVDFEAGLIMSPAQGGFALTSLEGEPAGEIESPASGGGWMSRLVPGVWCLHGHAGIVIISLTDRTAFRVFEPPRNGTVAKPSLAADRRGLRVIVNQKAYRCEVDLTQGRPLKTPPGLRGQVGGGTDDALFHSHCDAWSFDGGPDLRHANGGVYFELHGRLPPRLEKEGGAFMNAEGALVQKLIEYPPAQATPVAWTKDGLCMLSLDTNGTAIVWKPRT